MQGNHQSAGAVVVYHKVMHTDDLLMRRHDFLNAQNQFFRGRCSEQRGQRVLCGHHAGIEDENRNKQARPAIERKGREARNNQR